MASLRKDARTGKWLVSFRWNGSRHTLSCRTSRKAIATRILARVEESLELLHSERLSVPPGVDVGRWIFSGGKVERSANGRDGHPNGAHFGSVCDSYLGEQVKKAPSTLSTERLHAKHLKRVIGAKKRMSGVGLAQLKSYSRKRMQEKYRGRQISASTVRKELTTFRQVWLWAQRNKHVDSPCPLLGPDGRWQLDLPKPKEEIKFQTWHQIERRIKRGGLRDDEIAALWASLFLDTQQVTELLQHVKEHAAYPFIYPMVALAAYSGIRRSEICRSEIEDFDFDEDQILVRERKRRKDRERSTRFVPMHRKLKEIMLEWFDEHPGGNATITLPCRMHGRVTSEPTRLNPNKASKHFKQTLKESRWEVVRGFHVLRHSFGSNLARTGSVPSETIGKWMGHSTDEMRHHYTHLFPQDGPDLINVLD